MNFKSLLLGAAAAASVLVGSAPAEAAPATCAYRSPGDFFEFTCDVTTRRNANGHKVVDAVFFDDGVRYKWSIVFWTEKGELSYAEAWFNDSVRLVTDAYVAKNGAYCIDNNNNQFCIY